MILEGKKAERLMRRIEEVLAERKRFLRRVGITEAEYLRLKGIKIAL